MLFEIKAERANAGLEHCAQTLLYTLLLEERVRAPVPAGLLFYTQAPDVRAVPRARNEPPGWMVCHSRATAPAPGA
jgi:DNA replication ATP-dependent helicase Dna2